MLAAGLVMVGVGSMMNANLTDQADFNQFMWPQMVRGVGLLMCLLTASRIAMGTLPNSEISNAAGLFNVLRNLGGAVGLAFMDTIRDIRVDYHWAQLIPAIDTNRAVVLEELTKAQLAVTGVLSDPAAVAIKQIADRVMVQAQVLAFNDLFLWIGAMYALSLIHI